jgi:tetratricopeptide (TPR) repeat protein
MRLLERALELSPNYVGARDDYAVILIDKGSYTAAAAQLERLLAQEPRSLRYRTLQAHATMAIGDYDTALDLLIDIMREHPSDAGAWLLYAQALRFLGRYDESVQALRRCLDLRPDQGEAYWALADLKGNFLTNDDIATIRRFLAGDQLDRNARAHMLYAMGQGLERAGDFAGSFAAYEEGARLFFGIVEGEAAARLSNQQEPTDSARILKRTKQVFSRRNFETRLVQAPSPLDQGTPLFVVGMPRAGSTLVEQILSSHSMVEGTRELPLIGDITRALSLSRILVTPNAFPECVLDMSREQFAALGREYLDGARKYRNTDRPYFVDKRPWNWLQVGLIHLILPHAKIIDVRRQPMAAGFAMFKQLLPIDASFSYDLEEIGTYYNKYVNLMEHWDSVLPGRVHFLQYERLVEDSESEIRRLLDYCGLPFEEGCLRYWETNRAVATPSAEQVRRPIFRDALEQWRNFEPWLGPLKDALSRPVDL